MDISKEEFERVTLEKFPYSFEALKNGRSYLELIPKKN